MAALERQPFADLFADLFADFRSVVIAVRDSTIQRFNDSTMVRVVREKPKRKRWDPEEHEKWIKKVFGKKVFPSSDAALAAARADRKLM